MDDYFYKGWFSFSLALILLLTISTVGGTLVNIRLKSDVQKVAEFCIKQPEYCKYMYNINDNESE